MGYWSVNKAEIIRLYNLTSRKFLARWYCDELAKWTERECDTVEEAIAAIRAALEQLSM